LEVDGAENLSELPEPYILAPNHSSKMDSFLMLVIFYKRIKRSPLYCVTRERAFYKDFKVQGLFCREWIFNLLGGYQVYSGKGNYKEALITHIAFVKNGYSTCIFPEGHISKDGNVGEAKGGVMFLSQKTNAPIIPVAIRGALNLNFSDFIRRKRIVRVTICKPIMASNFLTKYEPKNGLYYTQQAQIVVQSIQKYL
jgi:1-acyl-sn-glycerol-3-phosphate acyltransferase